MAAHVGDVLPGFDGFSFFDMVFVLVPVKGDGSVFMLNAYPVSVSTYGACVNDYAVLGGVNGGSLRVGDVHSIVEGSPSHFEASGEGAGGGGDSVDGSVFNFVLECRDAGADVFWFGFVVFEEGVGEDVGVCGDSGVGDREGESGSKG